MGLKPMTSTLLFRHVTHWATLPLIFSLSLSLQVQNFWSSETRLPEGTLDRLVAMLEAMYSPVTEQQYLSYATNLILEMTSKSPDYQREIFEHPLSDCKFSVSYIYTRQSGKEVLYGNIYLKLWNKLHGSMHYKIGISCVFNGHVFYTLL